MPTNRDLERDLKRGKLIPNPDYEESEADANEARDNFWQHPFVMIKDFENKFPEDFKKNLPPEGKWIQIKEPPSTEFTVPPFSIWFAVPWGEGRDGMKNRVKIVTPSGTLGLWPHEYWVIDDVTKYIGREPEGILVHHMNDKPVVEANALHYLMSRGIPRREASMLLIGQIKDPTFLWLEFAPKYGEHFGHEWPDPKECPFAKPHEEWVPTQETAEAK